MSRNYIYLGLFLILSIFSLTTCFALTVGVSTEPEIYYNDTNQINLIFTISGAGLLVHNLTLSNAQFLPYFVYGNKSELCSNYCDSYSNYAYNFTTPNSNYTTTIKYILSKPNLDNRLSDKFEYFLGSNTVCELNSCPESKTFDVLDGRPSFSIGIYDTNIQAERNDGIPKSNSFKIMVKGLKDNVDDAGNSYISCTYTISGKSTTETISTWTATLNEQDYSFTPINATDIGAGTYDLTVTCYDNSILANGLSTQKITKLIIEDKKPQVDSITITPSTVYPDTKVTCDALVSDADDVKIDKNIFWKYKTQTINANQFDCSTNSCSSGDKFSCYVTPYNTQIGQSDSKEVTVSSYFSNVKISNAVKSQINQEEEFTATLNYTGTGTITYTWSFGDGATATGQKVKHAYTSKGNFNVTLTVNDDKRSTETATSTIAIVDADLVIAIKSPIANQEATKGENLNIKVSLNDNTGSPITDANVTAKIKYNDLNFDSIQLTKVSSSAGLYEGNLQLGYLLPSNIEIEVTANYTKGTIKLFNKKSVPISLTAIDLVMPKIELETRYSEPIENTLTVGNTINKIKVCFALPDSSFDDKMQGKLIISAYKDYEFKLDELENKCYNFYPEYKILKEDLDSGLTIKFKETKDSFDNYVKASSVKKYDIKASEEVLDLVLVYPTIDKLNVGQKVNIKAKYNLKPSFTNTLEDVKLKVIYKGKEYDLESAEDNSFVGAFLPDPDPQINFRLDLTATYNNKLIEESISKTLTTTNALLIDFISPNNSGVISDSGKIILAIKYQNNELYDGNSITLNLGDENKLFTRITEGTYAGYYEAESNKVGFFKTLDLTLKGQDEKGNTLLYSANIPSMALGLPLFVYYILFGILILILIIGISVKVLFGRQSKIEKEFVTKMQGMSADQLDEELSIAKSTLSELQRKFFKMEISEDTFKMQKIELEKKISYLETKIKTQNKQEQNLYQKSSDHFDNLALDKKSELEKKLNLQSDIYTKYKEEIETMGVKLKPYKDKYSPEEMRATIKQSKGYPEEIIDKIIQKIYD